MQANGIFNLFDLSGEGSIDFIASSVFEYKHIFFNNFQLGLVNDISMCRCKN